MVFKFRIREDFCPCKAAVPILFKAESSVERVGFQQVKEQPCLFVGDSVRRVAPDSVFCCVGLLPSNRIVSRFKKSEQIPSVIILVQEIRMHMSSYFTFRLPFPLSIGAFNCSFTSLRSFCSCLRVIGGKPSDIKDSLILSSITFVLIPSVLR